MVRRSHSRRAPRLRLPGPLRPVVGGLVLVGAIRSIDATWRRVTGRPTPTSDAVADGPSVHGADEARGLRDRVVYALLLAGAMRIARRLGLPKDGERAGERAKDVGR